MKPELLAPAGTFEAFKQAIFNGADAVYLATEKNLELEPMLKKFNNR
ncbi:MAG: hypothetical protein L6U99_12290 [Clostridium sp.]|nr:MAG: hypothetical protein L6U99_12290 [Clostridium sp.]